MLIGFPGCTSGKEPTCQCRRHKRQGLDPSLGWEGTLEEGMAAHSGGSEGKRKISLQYRRPWVWFLGWEDPLEEGMATHSSILAWRIIWREEPGRLQSMGSERVRHNWATTNTYIFYHLLCFYSTFPTR